MMANRFSLYCVSINLGTHIFCPYNTFEAATPTLNWNIYGGSSLLSGENVLTDSPEANVDLIYSS